MTEVFNHPLAQQFLSELLTGKLNLFTEITWIVIGTALSMVSGAIGGMVLASKDIGYEFSATLGALFAPAGVIPALILGFTVLNLLP